MTVRRILRWLPLLVLLTADVTAEAQRDRSQDPARQRKAQIKRQKERNDQKEAAFRQGRKDHWKAQDRSTRKRWRAQRRAAKRMRGVAVPTVGTRACSGPANPSLGPAAPPTRWATSSSASASAPTDHENTKAPRGRG